MESNKLFPRHSCCPAQVNQCRQIIPVGPGQVTLGPQQVGLGIIHLKPGLYPVLKPLFSHLQQSFCLFDCAGQGGDDFAGLCQSVAGSAQLKGNAVPQLLFLQLAGAQVTTGLLGAAPTAQSVKEREGQVDTGIPGRPV